MTHSDGQRLVLPPKLAPIQVVIVPITKGREQLDAISEKLQPVISALRKAGISVKYDDARTSAQDSNSPTMSSRECQCAS
mgnify:CR=1 FL=1